MDVRSFLFGKVYMSKWRVRTTGGSTWVPEGVINNLICEGRWMGGDGCAQSVAAVEAVVGTA